MVLGFIHHKIKNRLAIVDCSKPASYYIALISNNNKQVVRNV